MEGETAATLPATENTIVASAPAFGDQATPTATNAESAAVTVESKAEPAADEKVDVAVEKTAAESKPKKDIKSPPSPSRASSGREQRVRKSVNAYDPTTATEKKERVIPNGKGEKLEDMPRVVANFKNITWSDPHLKMLHTIVFGVGKKKEFKSHLLQFNGFVFPKEVEEEEREKLKQKMYKLVLADLKEVMDLCDINRSAESFGTKGSPDKEMLCSRFLEWLENPKSSGKKVKAEKKTMTKKAPATKMDSAKKRGKPKRSTTKDQGSAKKAKRAAKVEVLEDNDEEEISFNIPGTTIEKVREKVKSIVENADRDQLTVKGVRKLLEDWLDADLTAHKDAIRALVMEAM